MEKSLNFAWKNGYGAFLHGRLNSANYNEDQIKDDIVALTWRGWNRPIYFFKGLSCFSLFPAQFVQRLQKGYKGNMG